MPLTLLAVLLAFAAPAPVAETSTILEDEAIVEVSRGARVLRRREAAAVPRVVLTPACRPIPPGDPAFKDCPADDWTPRHFSRPPPL